MNWLIVKNDFKRNRVINFALFLFMMFSAALTVMSVVMAVQTFSSISELYKKAEPPHFVQMHKGDINQQKIDKFMSEYKGVTYWQTDTMIDVFGDNLTVVSEQNTYDLSDCRLDIGLVKQNKTKDLLLNSTHEKVILKEGEIGVPILLKEMYEIEIGDGIILSGNGIIKEFVVSEYILDSMMNSPMVSSTRILISDTDYDILQGMIGENEYLIEAYFTNTKEASNFQTAYENAGLPQNGQAVTYSIIFLLSALTDITTVFVLFVVSVLLVIVSFICVRFTIMAALEEEVQEIGTMKAIGIPFRDIRNIYLYKYRAIAIVAVTFGYVIALLLSSIVTKHISESFGSMGITALALVLSVISGVVVFIIVNFYCKRVLNKIKKVTVVDSLVTGKGFSKDNGSIKDGLYKSNKLSVNWLMGIREVFYKFKNWITVFVVVLIAIMMIMIPVNLLYTFEAPEFITYMGSSLEDILIEVENGENLENGYAKVKNLLQEDIEIENVYEYRRVRVQSFDADNMVMNINVDSGQNSGNELQYLSGNAPIGENEIALSFLNADEIGKETGDKIDFLISGVKKEFVISGIYQDVTSGGYTAKSKYEFTELESDKYTFSVNLIQNVDVEKKADEWTEALGVGITVDPMKDFINQTLGGVAKQLKSIVFAIAIVGVLLAILITVLFLKLRLAKDLSEVAVLKAIGFSEHDIKIQYMIKIGCVSLVGILSGIIFTNILGEKIVNLTLSVAGLGIKKVSLIVNPAIQVMCPLLLLGIMLFVTSIAVKTIKKYNIISIINE